MALVPRQLPKKMAGQVSAAATLECVFCYGLLPVPHLFRSWVVDILEGYSKAPDVETMDGIPSI